ncbi:MAG: asparagine synthase (glutamine-hydrolyzing) [Rhodanobacteraceae bacterium]
MCGICGVFAPDTSSDGFARIERATDGMLQAMAHRGPDGCAMASARPVSMAANRLAIRGVDQAHPPLIEYDSGILVACNGEIDNHRELRERLARRGHAIPLSTDVAVIAPLYLERGLDFLQDLQGVFAIALWDARTQRLILARDRAGERHLYYTQRRGATWFASELAALVQGGVGTATLDSVALAEYLRSGYCPSPHSLLAECHKVRPGERIVIEAGRTQRVRYWQMPAAKACATAPTTHGFDPIFRAAVRRPSDIDADYGVLLSGGVDSALITAVARSLRPGKVLPAYCIRFGEASYDEGDTAARIAQSLGCDFRPVTVGAQDFPATLRSLICTTGEPLADPAWVPLAHLTANVAPPVRVLLSGEGADELFAGYPTYTGATLASSYARLPSPVRRSLQTLIERLPVSDRKMTVSFLLKRFLRGQHLDGLARHVLWTANLTPEWLRRLGVQPPPAPVTPDGQPLLDVLQQHDFVQSLPEGLLAKADRGAMLHGVEIRAPFLDRRVIEFARSLSPDQRLRGLRTKVFLKRYALQYLPRSVIRQRKRGLSVPLAAWLRGPLRDWAHAHLAGDALAGAGLHTDAALRLFDEHQSHAADHARGIWTLIVLSEWLRWLAAVKPLEGSRTAAADPSGGDVPLGCDPAGVKSHAAAAIPSARCAGKSAASPIPRQ